MKRALNFPCPTCEAAPKMACTSLGRLTTKDSPMVSVHAARRRLANPTNLFNAANIKLVGQPR